MSWKECRKPRSPSRMLKATDNPGVYHLLEEFKPVFVYSTKHDPFSTKEKKVSIIQNTTSSRLCMWDSKMPVQLGKAFPALGGTEYGENILSPGHHRLHHIPRILTTPDDPLTPTHHVPCTAQKSLSPSTSSRQFDYESNY